MLPKFEKKKKKKKKHFPNGIFRWNLAQVREPEYIYNFEIKLEKKIFCVNMVAKISFVILRNNANSC